MILISLSQTTECAIHSKEVKQMERFLHQVKEHQEKKPQPDTEKNSFAIIIKLKIDFNCRLVDIITVLSLKLSVLLVFKAKYKNKLPGLT